MPVSVNDMLSIENMNGQKVCVNKSISRQCSSYLARDAMPARYAVVVCLSVCQWLRSFSRDGITPVQNEMTWTSLISSGVTERRKQYLVCLHWRCYSRHVNVNRLQLLAEANRSLCAKKKSWKQWLWEWPLLAWKLELDSSSSSSSTTVPSAWRTLQRWLCLGLDSVSNQLPRPRLGPFTFCSVCRERDNCANMLNIQI